jgi:hypothetical protein
MMAMYYTRYELHSRMSLWYSSGTLCGAFGGVGLQSTEAPIHVQLTLFPVTSLRNITPGWSSRLLGMEVDLHNRRHSHLLRRISGILHPTRLARASQVSVRGRTPSPARETFSRHRRVCRDEIHSSGVGGHLQGSKSVFLVQCSFSGTVRNIANSLVTAPSCISALP